jgi:hypothetical protein
MADSLGRSPQKNRKKCEKEKKRKREKEKKRKREKEKKRKREKEKKRKREKEKRKTKPHGGIEPPAFCLRSKRTTTVLMRILSM